MKAHGDREQHGLSPDFSRRIEERLTLADRSRHHRAVVRRWQGVAWLSVPVICAVCWAVLPVTFGDGVRSFIGALGYVTMLLSIAQDMSKEYLNYLGLWFTPPIVDVLLLIGVVSWLIWAARPDGVSVPGPEGAS